MIKIMKKKNVMRHFRAASESIKTEVGGPKQESFKANVEDEKKDEKEFAIFLDMFKVKK